MDQQARILAKFESFGFTPKSYFTNKYMKQVLNDISIATTNVNFDETIAEEIWQ